MSKDRTRLREYRAKRDRIWDGAIFYPKEVWQKELDDLHTEYKDVFEDFPYEAPYLGYKE